MRAVFLFTFVSLGLATTLLAEELAHSIFAGSGESTINDQPYQAGEPDGDRTRMPLGNPFGIEIAGDSIWITSVDDHCIYRGTINGNKLRRVAGTGQSGYSGDGTVATKATFNWPHEVRADQVGNLYVADTRNHVIRRIDASDIVSTVAGTGKAGYAGDGKSGNQVQFKQPHSVILDGEGGLLVADTGNHRLRRIDLQSGIVETISGTGAKQLPIDGADARTSALFGPRSLAVESDSIWIALREGNSIWRIDRKTDKLHHVAGTGKKGYTGDGGPPLEATFSGPKGLVIDDQHRILVVDTENHAVRRIDLKRNLIETILGGTLAAQSYELKRPHGISFSPDLGYVVADSEFHRVIVGR